MSDLVRFSTSWAAGWIIYMVAVLLWGFDGVIALILQPICAAVVSTACLGAVLLVGLVLRVRPVGRLWHSRRAWAAILVAVCLAVMVLGSSIGLTGAYADPDTGRRFMALHPVAALLSYLVLLFALAHWPKGVAERLA